MFWSEKFFENLSNVTDDHDFETTKYQFLDYIKRDSVPED